MQRGGLVSLFLILALTFAAQSGHAAKPRASQNPKGSQAAKSQTQSRTRDASAQDNEEQLQKGAAARDAGDFGTAKKIFRPLAEKGDDNASFALGLMAARGEGGQQDFREAERWWNASAASGNPLSQFNLGLLYYTGALGNKNYAKAKALWSAAALQKQPDALYGLGILLVNGAEGVPRNLAEGLKNFEQAAAFGHAMAEFELGNAYNAGEGVKKDRKKAGEYYKKAAAKGLAEAKTALDAMDAEK
ncbi:MAG: sel1 repeat family protein [Desulfovibrio sp.]|jgi:TPR repeat protein|nr:sel1 repeat family protein [Desulfovibrio sp.]